MHSTRQRHEVGAATGDGVLSTICYDMSVQYPKYVQSCHTGPLFYLAVRTGSSTLSGARLV